MTMPWDISSDDLVGWAARAEAPHELPRLVRRLLLATTSLRSVSMRADAGVRVGGWDGMVESGTSSAFCPAGTSMWELSTTSAVKAKFDDDYSKRTATAGGAGRKATYVAVSCRRWPGKDEWAANRRAERRWADVRALDADDLAAWIETAPAVGRWFAALLGRPAADVTDLESYLGTWGRRTIPPLPVDLALVGRERLRQKQAVLEWATAAQVMAGTHGPAPLVVCGDTEEDARLFVAAAVAARDVEDGDQLAARSVVVESMDGWRWLTTARHQQPPILLISATLVELAVARQAADAAGVFVVLLSDRNTASSPGRIDLGPIPHTLLAGRLSDAGIGEADATRLARESGGCLGALQRMFKSEALPAWIARASGESAVVMLLAGAWEPSLTGDQDAVRQLGGDPDQIERLCSELSGGVEPALRRETERFGRGHWTWISPADAWRALARRLTESNLRRFAEVVTSVLGEDDPKYDMPVDRRFFAAVEGKVLGRSEALRRGLAESLVRLAMSNAELRAAHGRSRGTDVANGLVRALLSAEWKRWASLSDLLPMLAEAAPEVFVTAVEGSLDRGDDGVAHLISQEERHGRSPHTGLLWALETVAWQAALMPRAAFSLARLAALDPGGQLSNRPLASLVNMLHPMLPQSTSTAEERSAVLAGLFERFEQVAWRAALAIIDAAHGQGFVVPSCRPRIRAWPLPPSSEGETGTNVLLQLNNTFALVRDHAAGDVGRWAEVLKFCWRYGVDRANEVLSALETALHDGRLADDTLKLWAAIRGLLHDGYGHGAHWLGDAAAPLCDRMESIYRDLTPDDPVKRHAWLFEPPYPLPAPVAADWRKEEAERRRWQDAALLSFWEERDHRWDLFERLAATLTNAAEFGEALARAAFAPEAESYLLGTVTAGSALAAVVPVFVAYRTATNGDEWFSQVLSNAHARGGDEAALGLLLAQGSTRRIWNFVESLGETFSAGYWRAVVNVFGEESADDWMYAIHRLLSVGRSASAFQAAGRADGQIDAATALAVLEALAGSPAELEKAIPDGMFRYYVPQLFEVIDRDETINPVRVANLEVLFYFVLKDTDRSAARLNGEMEQQPQFFAELVALAWPRVPEAGVSEEERRRVSAAAASAHRILSGWDEFPGHGLEGAEREAALLQWARTVLKLTSDANLKAAGVEEVAKVLVRVPASATDGLWPCDAARELLETGRVEGLADELRVARQNARGVVSRSPGEGGRQEREMAAAYRDAALQLRTRWPRTAAMLDGLRLGYEQEAERVDAAAETERLREGIEDPSGARSAAARRPPTAASRRADGPDTAPPVPFERITRIECRGAGPFESMRVDLRRRLNLLIGSNGGGKTFILDLLWWCQTNEWVDRPAWPWPPAEGKANPCLSFTADTLEVSCDYERMAESWRRPADLKSSAVAFYARAEGGWAIWDPLRAYRRADGQQAATMLFERRDVWHGLEGADDAVLCSGLIHDLVDWRARNEPACAQIGAVLRALSVPGDTLELGEPRRLSSKDARDFPTVRTTYGDVPIVIASAAVRRIVSLAYGLVWAWNEHKMAAKLGGVRPAENIALYVDELEAHLHPVWQRRILPALLEVCGEIAPEATVQIVASTHAPLVLASVETEFDKDVDGVLSVGTEYGKSTVEEFRWEKQGNANNWLTSDAFGLLQARSIEAERAVEVANRFMRGEPVPDEFSTKEKIHDELMRVLPGHDTFWPRWIVKTGPS